MIEKSQKWLAKYVGFKSAYRIVFTTYIILVSIPLILLGYLFDCIQFMIIGSLIINTLRSYTYGYHNKSNLKCTIFTYTMLIIFGYISKSIPSEWTFFIAVLSSRYIYINAPLELTHENKSRQWHRNKIQYSLIGCLICSIIAHYFNFDLIASDILWSLNVVAITLFKDIDE